MKGVVWGSSCSIWWQNTDLENFVRENSEVWLTYYFYWLWSFKVYNNAYVNDVPVNVWKTRFLPFFSWCSVLSNFLLRCQTYLYSNPVTYPVGFALCLFHWLWWISTLCLLPLIPKSFFLSRLPEKIGGKLPGVHYIRDVADADSLVSSLVCSVD